MKAGYNNTDIGVIPEDWEINTYGKVFDFLSTISNSRSELSFKGDFDYIHYGDIHVRWTNTLDLNKHELPKIKREKIKNLPAAIKDGDLVMADASEDYEGIAKTIEVKNVGQKVIFSGLHTFLMRDRNNYFVDGLRGYLHEIPVVKQQIHKVATGLKVFGVSKNTLKNIVIPIPKPEEQKAILAALSDTDGLIESLEKFIHKKRDMKTATMQQLLTGKKRLSGFNVKWETIQLNKIGKTYGGLSGKVKYDFGHGSGKYIPFLNIMNNVVINTKFLEVVDISQNEKQNAAKKGDLFFNGSSETPDELGYCSLLKENIPSLYLNSFCFGFRFYEEDNHDGLFFAYLFRSSVGRDYIYSLAQGATRYNLSKTNFLKLNISLPRYEEQKSIASILSDMDSEIKALEQRLEKTKALKVGMIQELLTGNIRLLKSEEFKEVAV